MLLMRIWLIISSVPFDRSDLLKLMLFPMDSNSFKSLAQSAASDVLSMLKTSAIESNIILIMASRIYGDLRNLDIISC